MSDWRIPFVSPEPTDRFDRANEGAFRLEVQRAMERLPALIEQRLDEIVARLDDLEQRVEALEDAINP
jgi:hypothetical protein